MQFQNKLIISSGDGILDENVCVYLVSSNFF